MFWLGNKKTVFDYISLNYGAKFIFSMKAFECIYLILQAIKVSAVD